MTFQELAKKYEKLKKWLKMQGIEIPISIEPYTKREYELRKTLPEIYWTSRDYEAIQLEEENETDWIN